MQNFRHLTAKATKILKREVGKNRKICDTSMEISKKNKIKINYKS